MYPGIFWDSLLSCAPIHRLVHVALEEAHSALVEDLEVVLALFSGVCHARCFRHEDLVYIRACHVLDFDPCRYGNAQSWSTLQ